MQPILKSKHIIIALVIIIAGMFYLNNSKIHALENALEEANNATEITVNETVPTETVEATEAIEVEETEATEVAEAETEPATEPETTEAEDEYTPVDQTVYAISGVNVRTGAGTKHDKLGELSRGEAVVRVGIGSNGWSKVMYNGKEAYVSTKYLTTDESAANNSGSIGYTQKVTYTSASTSKAKHSHSYSTEVVNPTCTEEGYTVHRCSCGDKYVDSRVKAYGHDYVDTVIAPTYTEQGYTLFTCTDCRDAYKDHFTDKLVAPTEPEVEAETEAPKAPEATEAPATEPEVPAVTEHVHAHYEVNVVEATCISGGFTTYKCDCGDSYNGPVGAPADHNYESQVVDPTTESEGYTLYVCSGCCDSYKDNFTDKIVVVEPETETETVGEPDANGHICSCGADHKHEEVEIGGMLYIYCSDVENPWRGQDGHTLYYPYDFYF